MNEKSFQGWVNVATLATAPAVVVALAYDHNWAGPALRAVGSGLAVICFLAAMAWVIATDGKPGN